MTTPMVAEVRPEVALADLGVSPELLSGEERRCLDVDGFVLLEDVVADDQLRYIRERIDERLRAQRPDEATDADVRRRVASRLESTEQVLQTYEARREYLLEEMSLEKFEAGLATTKGMCEALRTVLAADDVAAMRAVLVDQSLSVGAQFLQAEYVEDPLFESDPVFDVTIQSARVLSAIAHALGPMFHILNLVARCPQPGQGQQGLHRTEHSARRIASTIWLIDDMTLDNGPTRIVPGSHLSSQGLPDEMEGDSTRTHPQEIKLVGRAGSVVVFDDRCWHGGSIHRGGGPRRVLISSFTQRDLYPSMPVHHPEQTLARLTPGQRWLLHYPNTAPPQPT